MRAKLALAVDLSAKAQALTGLYETSGLVRKALRGLIERDSRRLARLGGGEPDREAPPRRRAGFAGSMPIRFSTGRLTTLWVRAPPGSSVPRDPMAGVDVDLPIQIETTNTNGHDG